jgi:hypothetical protein
MEVHYVCYDLLDQGLFSFGQYKLYYTVMPLSGIAVALFPVCKCTVMPLSGITV